MALGFREACKACISFGKDDRWSCLAAKEKLIEETRHRVREFEQQYQEASPPTKRIQHVVDAWSKCTDQVGIEMMREISQPQVDPITGRTQELNSIS